MMKKYAILVKQDIKNAFCNIFIVLYIQWFLDF